ncbi:MAG: pyruvate carboxylase subunit B [Hyphomicrobiales bacterium]
MSRIQLVETSFRDGQQSLWATRMTNAMILPFLPRLDNFGFDVIDLIGGAVFDVCVRFLREDPWERMRLASGLMKKTPLNLWSRGQSLFTFEMFPDDIVDLTVKRVAANGIKRYTCYDTLHDIRNIALSVNTAKQCGMHASGHVVYTISPAHTDEFYANAAREIAKLGVDSVGIKDPSGLLTPERAKTLVPAIRAVIGDLPLEMHSHCRSGLGELVCLTGIKLGVNIIHLGVRPLAASDALPDARYCTRWMRSEGHEVLVDDADIGEMEDYLTAVALEHGKPIMPYNRYDPFLYHHQVPGGMISNLHMQLRDLNLEHKLEAVLEEAGRVRADLGYPILVSPFAQFIITQATINVMSQERYASMPDEVVRYVLGYYGRPVAPIDPEVLDRIDRLTGGAEPNLARPGEVIRPRLPELRKEYSSLRSEDDLVTASYYQPKQFDAFMNERNKGLSGISANAGLREALRKFEKLQPHRQVSMHHGGVRVELAR